MWLLPHKIRSLTMVRGLYTSWTGMINEQKRLDVVSNNLANANTTAFKKQGVTLQSFDEQLAIKINDETVAYRQEGIGDLSLGVKIGETYTDYSQGSLKQTGNTFDLALSGEGFFTISMTNKNGETSTMYSRDGSFVTTKEGYLVTKDGNSVLSDNGQPILIPGADTAEVSIDQEGNIFANQNFVAKLGIVDFADKDYLSIYGENLYEAVDGATITPSNTSVMQGFLETSNVNVINEMVNMITITRAYETNQKLIQTIDGTLQKSVNEIGKV